MMFTNIVAFSLISLQCGVTVFGSEPVCSRFHYEEQLLEKMIRQEIAFEKMKSEMEDMKHKVETTLNDIGIEKDIVAMDLEKKNVATFEQMKRTLESTVNDIKAATFEQMERKVESTFTDIKARNDEHIKTYSEEMETVKASLETPLVAFKAHIATDTIMSDNKTIVFTENLLNLGDAYNNKTGIFVAPVAGLYMISAQICFVRHAWMVFGIFKQNKLVSSIATGDKEWYLCSTFDSVTLLSQEEDVSVRCVSSCSSKENLWEYDTYATNSFSGVLLHTLTV